MDAPYRPNQALWPIGGRAGLRRSRRESARAVHRGLTLDLVHVHDECMAVKTITIDLGAYEALRRRKRTGQSFSQVIKEHFDAPKTGRDLQAALRQQFTLRPDTLDAIEDVVRRRAESPAGSAEL